MELSILECIIEFIICTIAVIIWSFGLTKLPSACLATELLNRFYANPSTRRYRHLFGLTIVITSTPIKHFCENMFSQTSSDRVLISFRGYKIHNRWELSQIYHLVVRPIRGLNRYYIVGRGRQCMMRTSRWKYRNLIDHSRFDSDIVNSRLSCYDSHRLEWFL